MTKRVTMAFLILFIIATSVLTSVAETDRGGVIDSLEKDGWVLEPGKEIDLPELAKLTVAIALSIATANPGPLYIYAADFLDDMILKFGKSVVMLALGNLRTTFGAGELEMQAGIATFRHWTTVKVRGLENWKPVWKEIRIPRSPNTHMLYIRWRRMEPRQPKPPPPIQPVPIQTAIDMTNEGETLVIDSGTFEVDGTVLDFSG